jgi:hypothetical protein
VVAKMLSILTAEFCEKATSILTINPLNQLIFIELLKMTKEKLLNSTLFINILRKVVEPKTINLKKLNIVSKLEETGVKKQKGELFLFVMVLILPIRK